MLARHKKPPPVQKSSLVLPVGVIVALFLFFFFVRLPPRPVLEPRLELPTSSIPPDAGMWPSKLSFDSTVTLPSGQKMPLMGFGLAALGYESENMIVAAIQSGFRLFDTAGEKAPWYRNEATLGSIVHNPERRPPEVKPQDFFLTTKLYPADLGYDRTVKAIEESRANLQVDAIDLFLIHFPFCHGQPNVPPNCGRWQDSWKAMEEASRAHKVRNIGVSNFDVSQLDELHRIATVPIAVVQSWADPWHQARDLRAWCDAHNVVFQAYSLLGTQWSARSAELQQKGAVARSARLQALGARFGVAPQLVILRWALSEKIAVIPRTSSVAHVETLKDVFNITLDDDDLSEIRQLDGVDPRMGL